MPTVDAPPPHRLRTLGALELTAPDGSVVSAHRRELLLLAYLAGHPRRADTRVAMATLLWEDRDDARARGSLRQALFRLRRTLPDVLLLDGETVALAPDRLVTDAGELLRLAAADRLDDAIARWTGDFLGNDEPAEGSALREWADAERERLRVAYRRVLDRRVVQAESAGDWPAAVAAAERLAALDPLDPGAGGRLATARRRAGDPAGALAGLDALAARRRAELDAGLPPRLTALVEELRTELADRSARSARAELRQAPDGADDAARARLLAAWRHVAEGADPVLVTAVAGAGRTRLLEELQATAAADGAIVLAARGYAADRDVPWATARPLLAPLADAPGLAGLAPAALARLAIVIPALRDAFPALPAVTSDDWGVLDAARAAIEEVATEVPVLVAVDDLPRADAMTRQLVLALARRLPIAGLCVVTTARDDELAPMPERAALLDLTSLHRVALPPRASIESSAIDAPPSAAHAPWWRRRAIALAAALGIATIGAGVAVRAARDPDAALDASLVAVAPFDVADADLTLWRHGMVDVLARRLDGAGALRTVPPTTVIRGFEGRGDPAGAAALGARTGAGLVVYGGIVHAGRDSVRLEARLFDVRRGTVVGEVRVHDALAAMDRAIDALGIGLLRELARDRPMGAVRTAGISAASLPALRAFLAAEQHYRGGEFQRASAAAEQAVALDSGFALAWHRLGSIVFYEDVETGARHFLRAAEARVATPLSPRDSTVIALDSLRGAALLAGARRTDRVPPLELAAPYMERLRHALLRFPEDPELRLAHAEALVRLGAAVRSTRDEQHAAYERAIALDSAFFPVYVEAVGIALATHHPERARHHLATMLRLARQPQNVAGVATLAAVVRADGTADTLALARFLSTASLGDLAMAFVLLANWPDAAAVPVRILRQGEIVARRERPEVWTRDVEPMLRAQLDHRGRLAERRALGGEAIAPAALVRDAILGAVPQAVGDSAAAAWLAGDAPWSDPQPLVWLAERADTLALRRFLARAERTPSARIARAYVALARRDTAGALAQLRTLDWRDCPTRCVANDVLRARLLLATGAVAEARTLVAGGSPAAWQQPPSAYDVLWMLTRARVAERVGDRARAAADYRSVVGLWATADAPLQPLVAEARAGLRRATAQRN
ncbi:AAA family ATPase [Roseisolibacter agri]|uniref:Bacterial transcriptional activator domain-containing protein n=1 Tax=Roseisolibacter agri TaxID=2014610 RepID=A0AA37PZT0_9BACT|nr:AAA family ATPase [Roseisolibacter agri]GLC23839.1 hypothetical protein rosag_03520 [Roseisolibacter agri]